MRDACALLLTCLALAGCWRKPPQPSPDYERAAVLYQQLYASKLDDAYGDPRMADVEAWLRKVDPRSADARAAKDLLTTIEHGRDEFAQAQERRRQMEAVSAADLKKTSNIDPQTVLSRSAPDGGGVQDPTGAGASIADLNRETGGCLIADQPFREEGTGKVGQLYRLAPSAVCAGKLPGFIGQAAMVIDGMIYRRIPAPRGSGDGSADAGTADAGAADAGPARGRKAETPKLPEGARLVSTDPDGTQHYQVPTLDFPGRPTEAPAAAGAPGAAAAQASSDALPDATPHPPPADATAGAGY